MDLDTGKIYNNLTEQMKLEKEKLLGHKLVPLTEKQAKELKPLSKRERKRLMSGGPCICGSGKSFKKCCIKQYKRKKIL